MRPGPVRFAGDSAVVIELEPRIDPAVNARAIAIAANLRQQRIDGVRDVVSAMRSVAVHFDPLRTDLDALFGSIERAYGAPAREAVGRAIEIPVVYGGEDGPDLGAVAEWAGLSEAEVIQRHSGAPYRVFMLGFVPGFPYMGIVDAAIAAPRRPTPRLKVAAGSVGIAGSQTGIYSRETPGGWQIIGRTTVPMFDASGDRPSTLAAGDVVTFVPVVKHGAANHGGSPHVVESGASERDSALSSRVSSRHDSPRTVSVISPGILTTVQDLGRWGHQPEGIPVSGAMDRLSHRIANRCVGNPDTAATLEVTIAGPELRMDAAATVAIAGADLGATLNGAPMAMNTPTPVPAGATLGFGARRHGARAYIAFDGGVDVPPLRGSRATDVASGMGGCEGRPLRAGDRLGLGDTRGPAAVNIQDAPPMPAERATLRVIPGPQSEFFDERGLRMLTSTAFTVSLLSNRMAYRLTAPAAIPRASGVEMISDATFTGGIQVTPAGDAILLMADRQTTGGYPQIATVISADLARAGQLAPGDTLTFSICSPEDARAALVAQERRFDVGH